MLFTGEQVVVKVQRPGLKQLFDIDLNNLRILAEQLDRVWPAPHPPTLPLHCFFAVL